MKRITFLMLILCLTAGGLIAQTCEWGYKGLDESKRASSGAANYLEMQVDGTTPFILFYDAVIDMTRLRKFSHGKWEDYGAPMPDMSNASFVMKNGVAFILYKKPSSGSQLFVLKNDGSTVTPISAALSSGVPSDLTLRLNSAGNPVICYTDYVVGPTETYVKEYDGSAWSTVGGASVGQSYYQGKMALDENDRPVFAYANYNGGIGYLAISRFDGTSWVQTATNVSSFNNISNLDVLVHGDSIYVSVLKDLAMSYEGYVFFYNGTSWTELGGLIHTNLGNTPSKMIWSPGGQPTVAFADNNYRIYIGQYNGTVWSDQSGTMSATGISNISIAYAGNNLTYAYSDGGLSGLVVVRQRIMGNDVDLQSSSNSETSTNAWNPGIISHPMLGEFLYYERFQKVIIRKYQMPENIWVPFDTLDMTGVSMEFHNDSLFVAGSDVNTGDLVLLKLSGNTWEQVGGLIISSGAPIHVGLEFSGNVPVVATQNLSGPGYGFVYYYDYSAGTWVTLGGGPATTIAAPYLTMAIDPVSSYPVIAFADNFGGGMSISTFDGANWVYLGTPGQGGFTSASFTNISINSAGEMFAFAILNSGAGTLQLKYDGADWVPLTNQIPAAGYSLETMIDANDKLVASYVDPLDNNKIRIHRYDGTAWEDLTSSGGLGYANSYRPRLGIDKYGNLSTAYIQGGVFVQILGTDAHLTFSDSVFCYGSNVALNANSGNNTYSWTGPNGFTSPSGSFILPGVDSNDEGYYMVHSTGVGCENDLAALVTIDSAFVGFSYSPINCFGGTNGYASAFSDAYAPVDYAWSNGELGSVADSLSGGIQSVTLTDYYGCVTIGNVNIPQGLLGISALSEDHAICAGDIVNVDGIDYGNDTTFTYMRVTSGCDSLTTVNINLSVIDTSVSISNLTLYSGTVGGTYQWMKSYWADGSMPITIAGATNSSYTVTESGNYWVEIADGNCHGVSNMHVVEIDMSSVNSLPAKKEFAIWPNPAKDHLQIRFGVPGQYQVIDNLGRVVLNLEVIENSEINIDLNNFAPGIYMIIDKERTSSSRFSVTE